VLEFQTSSIVTRCDGPTRLFPRVYDFEAGRFRPVMSPLPEPGSRSWSPAAAIRRCRRAAAGRLPLDRGVQHARLGRRRARAGLARRAERRGRRTAWAEGMGGDGRGEFVTARSTAGGYAVRGLRVFPGDGAEPGRVSRQEPPAALPDRVRPGARAALRRRDPRRSGGDAAHWRDPFWVPLPKPMPASCVTVIVTEVALGKERRRPKSFGAAAIGDLAVFTDIDSPQGAERLVADLAAAPTAGARLPLLVGMGQAAVLPTAQAVLGARDTPASVSSRV
jgi:hypothetical protein